MNVSNFTYFYKPTPMRSFDEIRSDIVELKHDSEGMLGETISFMNSRR